jgi:short-subunit dehydrogenase
MSRYALVTGATSGIGQVTGVRVQVVCPGAVATEFHERQGMDLSMLPRMTADDVVTASPRGLDHRVRAPGVAGSAQRERSRRSARNALAAGVWR